MNSVEERNIKCTEVWESAWNEDVMRMVDECYSFDCEVHDMIRGVVFHGREELRSVEKQMMDVDASRRMKIYRMVASGDTVVAEMYAEWQDGTVVVKACAILTFDDDGLIVSDHSYSADPLNAAATSV